MISVDKHVNFIFRTRSVADSVSENLLHNLSIKNRTAEAKSDSLGETSSSWQVIRFQFWEISKFNANPTSSNSYSFLRESLQLQHSTNLNIQRSQSTQRFATNNNIGVEENNSMNIPNYDDSNISISASASDSNYIENSNFYGKSMEIFNRNLPITI